MRVLHCLLAGGMSFALGGCAGYRLGPTGGQVAGAKSVQIVPFTNQTMQPRLGDSVTGALRKEIQRDATFKLATHDAGDIVVSGVITDYDRHASSFVTGDVITPRDYRVVLTARVTARERATGKVLFDKPIIGQSLMRTAADLTRADRRVLPLLASDLTSADRQVLPLLAADLARQVTQLLADGTW